MEKGIKTLTRLSFIFRKWTTVSNSISVIRPVQHVARCNFANYSVSQEEKHLQEFVDKKIVNEVAEKEIYNLLESLTYQKDSKRDLNTFVVLQNLVKLYKQANHRCQSEDIINHKGFLMLCDILVNNSTSMSLAGIVHYLRTLLELHVPVNSVIIQRFLQLLRPSINRLTLPVNLTLLILLEQHQNTKLSKALYEASKIVLQEHIRTDLNTQNTELLFLCLRYAIKLQNDKDVNRVVYALWKLENIDVKYLASLFLSLCQIVSYTDTYWKLMNRLQDQLAEEFTNPTIINNVAWAEDKIINFITKRYKRKFQIYYNTTLMRVLTNNAISRKLPFKTCVDIASFLYSIRQLDLPLLDFLAIQFCKENDKGTLIQDKPLAFVEFIRNLAAFDYKPFLWKTIQDQIMELKECNFSRSELLILCHSLAVLECDNAALLKQLFDTLHEVTDLSRDEKISLVQLYCAIKACGTKYSGLLPDDHIMAIADEVYEHCLKSRPRPVFTEVLAKALGSKQYLQCHLRTRLGHFVDYAIVIDRDGHPIPISKPKEEVPMYLEDIQTSESDKVILVFPLPSVAYFDHRISGAWAMTLRSLEAYTGYDIVPINYRAWIRSNPREQIPFIMQAIKLKCGSLCEVNS